MQDEDSEYENASQSYRFDSRPSQSIDYQQLIRIALLNYKDIQDDDFILLSENVDISFSLSDASLQYNRHTLVPIGANFQAVIPAMMTEAGYKSKSADQMRALRILKINDPQEGTQFYNKYIGLVNELVGPDRTYQDVNLLHNAFKKLNSKANFQEYLSKNQKYWETFFKTKERASTPRPVQKKKKKKGTIPI